MALTYNRLGNTGIKVLKTSNGGWPYYVVTCAVDLAVHAVVFRWYTANDMHLPMPAMKSE